jgi:hypothetical protein
MVNDAWRGLFLYNIDYQIPLPSLFIAYYNLADLGCLSAILNRLNCNTAYLFKACYLFFLKNFLTFRLNIGTR